MTRVSAGALLRPGVGGPDRPIWRLACSPGWGFVLPMAVGAILMSTSTVVVALNAQLLRRVQLREVASTSAPA